MKFSHILFLIAIIFITASWFYQPKLRERKRSFTISKSQKRYVIKKITEEKWRLKAADAKNFIRQKNYDNNYCFLIDMSLPSANKRFVIYDLKKDSIIDKGLVAHGNCFEYWLEGRRYSNVVGSGCTSLGKYKIGNPYTGKFGYSYKLHGLDSTNNNAFERTVVLHAHSCIPEKESSDEICQSNGCPTVSLNFLVLLKKIISHSNKPFLLWIYE
ncbi:MAG: murein L,D-transpeptidase catalytic domain-containing protein [Chitinophagaceae bacterium]